MKIPPDQPPRVASQRTPTAASQRTPATSQISSLLLLATGKQGLTTAEPKKFNSGHLGTDIVRFLRQHKETEAERNQADFGGKDCSFEKAMGGHSPEGKGCLQREKGTLGVDRGGVVV